MERWPVICCQFLIRVPDFTCMNARRAVDEVVSSLSSLPFVKGVVDIYYILIRCNEIITVPSGGGGG